MSEVPLADMRAAAKLVVMTHLRPPDDSRLTAIRYRIMRHLRVDDINDWLNFDGVTEEGINRPANLNTGSSPDFVPRRVGTIALNRNDLLNEMDLYSDSQFGLMRAVGNAVVFGPIPQDALPNDGDPESHDYIFGVCLGAGALRVLPVLRSNDGQMRVPDADVALLGIAGIDALPLTVRVY